MGADLRSQDVKVLVLMLDLLNAPEIFMFPVFSLRRKRVYEMSSSSNLLIPSALFANSSLSNPSIINIKSFESMLL